MMGYSVRGCGPAWTSRRPCTRPRARTSCSRRRAPLRFGCWRRRPPPSKQASKQHTPALAQLPPALPPSSAACCRASGRRRSRGTRWSWRSPRPARPAAGCCPCHSNRSSSRIDSRRLCMCLWRPSLRNRQQSIAQGRRHHTRVGAQLIREARFHPHLPSFLVLIAISLWLLSIT